MAEVTEVYLHTISIYMELEDVTNGYMLVTREGVRESFTDQD